MINNFEKVYQILKKIEKGNVFDYNLDLIFNNEERILIKLLFEQGYIYNNIDKETNNNRVLLTNIGKMSIYAVEHKEDIIRFKDLLEYLNYNTTFILDFIKTRDFKKDNILLPKDYADFLEEKKEIYNDIKVKKRKSSN